MGWPPYSPYLSLIEAVRNRLKDYLDDKYGLEECVGYGKLRGYVNEAWGSINDQYLIDLLASIP